MFGRAARGIERFLGLAHAHPVSLAPDRSTPNEAIAQGELRFPLFCYSKVTNGVFVALFAVFLLFTETGFAQTAPGTQIDNTASVAYANDAGLDRLVASNDVSIVVAAARTPSQTEFIRLLPGGTAAESLGSTACLAGGQEIDLGIPSGPDGSALDPNAAQALTPTALFSLNETVFIRVRDLDQNLDPALVDTVDVQVRGTNTTDVVQLRLTESDVNTGVFTGFVSLSSASPVAANCVLETSVNSAIEVVYVDPLDAGDSSQAVASINPLNIVFDSTTGEIVDGALITLVDVASGQPATVYGNDGVSAYPSTVRSGEAATDASGLRYAVPPGGYNFPVVPAGTYRLVVVAPEGFLAPSGRTSAEIASLPGSFTIEDGSFALPFTLVVAGPTTFDIPVDPFSGGLFLSKSTQSRIASPGDFIQYVLRVENTAELTPALNVQISDDLPVGFLLVDDSIRVNDVPVSEFVRTESGFQVRIGTVAAGEIVTVSYVVEVSGAASGEEAVNTAQAQSDRGLVSNKAEAAVLLKDELNRDRATIIGRVLESSCINDTFSEADGVEGIRIYLEDGRYVVSDENGRFHFEDIRPGTHVVQMDDDTIPSFLELTNCVDNAQAASSKRSQFVEARGGALHRADFYLKRKSAPEGRVELELTNSAGNADDEVHYTVDIDGIGDFSVNDLSVTVIMPSGVSFKRSSARLVSGEDFDVRRSGPALIFRLGERRGEWADTISFDAVIAKDVEGRLETRAVASFDTPAKRGVRTPLASVAMEREAATTESADYVLSLKFHSLSAELSASDRAELDGLIAAWRDIGQISLSVIGHTDSIRIAARNRHVFADNEALSLARAQSVANYLASRLGIESKKIDITGLGAKSPVASNATAEGREKNRRVELIISGSRAGKRAFLSVTEERSGQQQTKTIGAVPGPDTELDERIKGPASMESILNAQKKPVPAADSLTPGLGFVLPLVNSRPAIPSIRVAFKHEPGQSVELLVNDEAVPALSADGLDVGRLSKVALTKWRGIRLTEGSNKLLARVTDANGTLVKEVSREVHFAGGPIRGEIVSQYSRLSADGKRRPIIAVRMFDGDGQLARTGSVGTFSVDAPYRSWFEVETSKENNIVSVGSREPLYRVEPDGIARIELEPTSESGELVLRLKFENQREQELRSWLTPVARDWILVGLAHGTVGYNTVSKNIVNAESAGNEEDFYDDGRVAFFAKGQIKGEYLLTLAYDTRGYAKDRSRFEGVIDPDAFYTLYGDGTESRFEAASQRKLFVKLERRQFSALFGDFDTGLSVTDLSRYERRFNGVQIGYSGQNFAYNAFATEVAQQFSRDELRGNGTSGLYRLSGAPIIPNSDTIRIEVRDRADASEVISSTTLSRFIDYDIDYGRGTLLFKRPIASRDDQFNPQFIVAEYETRSAGEERQIAGGRVALKTTDNRLEVGASYISEEQQNGTGELQGVDVRWRLGDSTTARAEYADSTSKDQLADRRGHAYRLELEHRTGRLDLEAYHARVDENFGLGQQSVSEIGLEKTGVNGRLNITDNTHLEAEFVIQENLDTGLSRDIASATLNTQRGKLSANLGILHARDESTDGTTRESNLATIALSQSILDDRFALRLSAEAPLNSEDAVSDYPSRILAGVDWNLGRAATAFVEHEISDGRDIESQLTRVGLRAQPWQRAQFDSSLSQEITEFGPRLFANIGAVQGWQINERWAMDIGVDHSNTLRSPEAVIFDDNRELRTGSLTEDFVSSHLGATYQANEWSGNARVEYRDADTGDSLNMIAGWYREPTVGHGMSGALEWFTGDVSGGGTATMGNLRFGWAYRLADQKWSFLNRSDFIIEERNTELLSQESWRIINNFNANKRLGAGSELSIKYGLKYVRTEFSEDSYSGFTDLIGVEYRHSFRPRWDFGLHADVYHSWRADAYDYSVGADIGFQVLENTWLAVGYNVKGFSDSDFSDAGYLAQGPFLRFSVKADQESLKRIANGFSRRR